MSPLHEEDDWVNVSSSDYSFSTENLSDDGISFDDSSSSVSFPAIPPPPTLMDAVLMENHDLGVADDYRGGGSFRRRTVILCGGIKYGDYINRDGDEDQCDDADEDDDLYDLDDELIPRSVSKKLKRGRMRKYGKRSFTKPGCIYGKYGFGTRFRC